MLDSFNIYYSKDVKITNIDLVAPNTDIYNLSLYQIDFADKTTLKAYIDKNAYDYIKKSDGNVPLLILNEGHPFLEDQPHNYYVAAIKIGDKWLGDFDTVVDKREGYWCKTEAKSHLSTLIIILVVFSVIGALAYYNDAFDSSFRLLFSGALLIAYLGFTQKEFSSLKKRKGFSKIGDDYFKIKNNYNISSLELWLHHKDEDLPMVYS